VPAIEAQATDPGLQRLSGRTFWFLWATIVLIAAAFYYTKAAEDRSAFVRWRPQVLKFWQGVNIYDNKMNFPTPPIMPITLYPLMRLPTITGAMTWFWIKVLLTTLTLIWCLEIVRPPGRPFPPVMRSLVLLLSLRPILGDLHHGNNNLLILFLVMAMFSAWRLNRDRTAGLLLALATAYKVTPALFFVYFLYKRSWRTFAWGLLGLGIFLLALPALVIGPEFNGECLGTWWNHMITPYVLKGATSAQEVNQTFSGVFSRLLTDLTPGTGRYQVHTDLNLFSLPPRLVGLLIKGVALGMVGLLALLCRTSTANRRDPRLLGEASLVVLTMLFISERSWKHHYVTMLLPYTYLAGEFFSNRLSPRQRAIIAASWVASFCLMASTSTDIGGLFGEGQAHEIAQGYGAFLWAGVALYATVAWRVWSRRREPSPPIDHQATPQLLPRPHFVSLMRGIWARS